MAASRPTLPRSAGRPTRRPWIAVAVAIVFAVAGAAAAVVSCDAGLGSAFFVAPEKAITNAHVLCGAGLLTVKLADGRELLGKPAFSDERLDVAVIDVVGAAASPLTLGDSTALVAGDPVVLVGNPSGLSFTVHEGKVSFVGRNLLGVGYLQVDANVNPGNSGGPLLDARGEVVGIVSMKIVGADALGLALPIEYARPHVGAPAQRPEAEARWKAIVARVEEEDRAEVARFAKRMAQPAILAADAGGRGTVALLVGRRFAGMPFDLSVDVEVRAGDRVLCEGTGRIGDWQSLEKALAKRLKRTGVPQARWALANGVARDVFVGVGAIDLRRCKADDVPDKAFIAIRGGEQVDLPVPFPREAFGAAAEHAVEEERLEEDQRKGDRAATEAKWRKAFRDARERIATLEKKRRELTARVTAMPFDDRAREELAQAEEELPRARRQYEDLEREASHAAVPREWRQ